MTAKSGRHQYRQEGQVMGNRIATKEGRALESTGGYVFRTISLGIVRVF